MVTLDLLVGSGVTYLGADAQEEIERLERQLNGFAESEVFKTSQGGVASMNAQLTVVARVVEKALGERDPSSLLPALDESTKHFISTLTDISTRVELIVDAKLQTLDQERVQLRQLASWGGIIYVLLLLLLGGFASRRIARPMGHLIRLSREERDGREDKYKDSPSLTGPREFVELSERLVGLVQNLEEIVSQRTEKLERQTVLLKGEVDQRKRAQESLLVSNQELESALERLQTAQEALLKQERLRAMGEMVSGLSHDFNNLLLPIVTYSALLLEEKSDEEESRQFLEIIQTAATDGAQLVARMRELYRGGPTEEEMKSVQVDDLVMKTLELARPRWASRLTGDTGIEVILELEAETEVPMLETQIRQALLNLILNAVDAMEEGGTLRVKTRVSDGSVHLEVTDSGTGMPPEVMERCFEPFFSTKEDNGTGLGLPMVYSVMEHHGGGVRVESVAGEGTSFFCQLPLAGSPGPSGELQASQGSIKGLFLAGEGQREVIERLCPSTWTREITENPQDILRHLQMGNPDFWCVLQSANDGHGALDMALLALQAGVPLRPVLILEEGAPHDSLNDDLFARVLDWDGSSEEFEAAVLGGLEGEKQTQG